ncbi:MAG TPA: glucose-6-phosphate isomerase, partial [Rhodospirillales bacterium]|nr:glucose-6-phosphate isomerase [Rhodospirillales bacterium]
MSYKHNFEFCLADSIGNSGLASAKFEKLMECATESINKLADKSHSDTQSLFGLVRTCEDLETLETIAEQYCEFFDHVIVLGTGGSSLGGQALTALAPIPRPKEVAARPTLHFMANIDPDSFERLFQKIEAERTGFLVISKSGSTAETMAQFIYCMDVFRK